MFQTAKADCAVSWFACFMEKTIHNEHGMRSISFFRGRPNEHLQLKLWEHVFFHEKNLWIIPKNPAPAACRLGFSPWVLNHLLHSWISTEDDRSIRSPARDFGRPWDQLRVQRGSCSGSWAARYIQYIYIYITRIFDVGHGSSHVHLEKMNYPLVI